MCVDLWEDTGASGDDDVHILLQLRVAFEKFDSLVRDTESIVNTAATLVSMHLL